MCVIALLAVGALALAGRGMLRGPTPSLPRGPFSPWGGGPTPEPVAETAAENKADQIERAVKEPYPVGDEASAPASRLRARHVFECSRYGNLRHSRGRGNYGGEPLAGGRALPGTGYPWVPGSNTYIAGHRIGYPGTPSDHVFWNLPNLGQGDQILLTDSNGTPTPTLLARSGGVTHRSIRDRAHWQRHGLVADLHRKLWGLLDTGSQLVGPLHRPADMV